MPRAGTYMPYSGMLCTTARACSASVPAFIYLFDISISTKHYVSQLPPFTQKSRNMHFLHIPAYVDSYLSVSTATKPRPHTGSQRLYLQAVEVPFLPLSLKHRLPSQFGFSSESYSVKMLSLLNDCHEGQGARPFLLTKNLCKYSEILLLCQHYVKYF